MARANSKAAMLSSNAKVSVISGVDVDLARGQHRDARGKTWA